MTNAEQQTKREASIRPLLNLDSLIRNLRGNCMESKRQRRYLVEVTALTHLLHTHFIRLAD